MFKMAGFSDMPAKRDMCWHNEESHSVFNVMDIDGVTSSWYTFWKGY